MKVLRKAHYVANKTRLVSEMRQRRIELKNKLWDYKSSLACTDCGLIDPIVLDFDHLSDKYLNVGKMANNGFSWEKIVLEIQKCEPVCANCHRRRTFKRAGWRQ